MHFKFELLRFQFPKLSKDTNFNSTASLKFILANKNVCFILTVSFRAGAVRNPLNESLGYPGPEVKHGMIKI